MFFMKNRRHRIFFLFEIITSFCCVQLVGQSCVDNSVRTAEEYLLCAAGSYKISPGDALEGLPSLPPYIRRLSDEDFSFLDHRGYYEDPLSGYAAALFLDERDSTIIISHRATEMSDSGSDYRDILADMQIAGLDVLSMPLAGIHKILGRSEEARESVEYGVQYPAAKKLYLWVRNYWRGWNIENVGHSLGGNLTQLISYQFGIKGVAFDPAGVGMALTLEEEKEMNLKNIWNYKIRHSLVGASVTTGQTLGRIIYLYPTDGVKILGTEAHGLDAIWNFAIDKNTGCFKTFDDVVSELWENNVTVAENDLFERPVPVQCRFDNYEAFKSYMEHIYMVRDRKDNDSIYGTQREIPMNRLEKVKTLFRETDLMKMMLKPIQ